MVSRFHALPIEIIATTLFSLMVLTGLSFHDCALGESSSVGSPAKEVSIGVLAKRGATRCLKKWGPTAEYLTSTVPGYRFKIVPLSFDRLRLAVERGEVDFVLANPFYYVWLEEEFGVSRIATLINGSMKASLTSFGGVVFTRSDHEDINSVEDLRGKVFAAVDARSFGGWIMAWYEFFSMGIEPERYFSRLLFSGTHDGVVRDVLEGRADAGTVRSDTLERMAREGLLDLGSVKLLMKNRDDPFPFLLSTRLYPEWPMAALASTSMDLARKVAVALMNMPADSPAARQASVTGWTIPLEYNKVRSILKELRIGPYMEFGRVSLWGALMQHWKWAIGAVVILFVSLMTSTYVIRLNKRLSSSNAVLAKMKRELADQVQQRTSQLREANLELTRQVNMTQETNRILEVESRRLATILASLSEAVIAVDRSIVITHANPAALRLIGLAEERVVGRSFNQVVTLQQSIGASGECGNPMRSVMESEKSCKVQDGLFLVSECGESVEVSCSASPIRDGNGRLQGAVVVFSDVSLKRSMEREAARVARLESIGLLAAGIAHDFNNILAAGLGNLNLCGCYEQVICPLN